MSDHPKVVGFLGDVGYGTTDLWAESDAATHKVVPLDALVIERDENGDWWCAPDSVKEAAEVVGVSWQTAQWFIDEWLDELEAAQKEKP